MTDYSEQNYNRKMVLRFHVFLKFCSLIILNCKNKKFCRYFIIQFSIPHFYTFFYRSFEKRKKEVLLFSTYCEVFQ